MKQENSEKQDKRTEKRKIGDLGENIACRFLMKRGFEIVERNYLKKWGEIDIIARKDGKLHFIEVKSVSHLPVSYETDTYKPEDNLHPWKLKRLSRVIQTYLLNYKCTDDVSYENKSKGGEVDWQFDVIITYLDLKGLTANINHMEDIVL